MSQTSLIDKSRNFYTIREKLWDFGYGDIYDVKGNTIGKMKRKILSLRKEISIIESDGNQVLTVNKKIASVRKTYDIKDSSGYLLGRTNKKILSVFRPKIWMEDDNGKKILLAQGSFAGWDFTIKNEKEIAEVSKSDRWRDIFAGGIFDYRDTYTLHVLDSNFDRRVLIGFVIAIDNSIHDKN